MAQPFWGFCVDKISLNIARSRLRALFGRTLLFLFRKEHSRFSKANDSLRKISATGDDNSYPLIVTHMVGCHYPRVAEGIPTIPHGRQEKSDDERRKEGRKRKVKLDAACE